MAPGRTRDEQKEQEWRRWIAQWRASGLSVRDFCDRHGLAAPSFYAWRSRLHQAPATRLLSYRCSSWPTRHRHRPAPELVLADGRVVRVAPGFDAATLRQLLTVLEGEGPC